MDLRRRTPHIYAILLLLFIIFVFCVLSGCFSGPAFNGFDPFEHYGKWASIILYVLRLLTLIPIPLSICNFLGIVLYNTFPAKPKLQTSLLFGPSLYFRVITRGTFPELVRRNVKQNMQTCLDMGLDNYIFEIATDNYIGFPNSSRVRELLIPKSYQTGNGTLFKARALHFCLEDDISLSGDNEWIVHLDEETVLTESSVVGIINFINEGKHSFGQGVITYANNEVVNWLTTIGDTVRVGIDYGILRFSMKFLHQPVFSWKGSFIVANAAAEKKIGFDFGPNGSIAEDCFFALSAWDKGYSFGFIEGEMWEKSTFTAMDYIQQRKRWFKGIIKALCYADVPGYNKMGICVMVLGWVTMPLTAPNMILVPMFPLPMPTFINFLCSFMGGVLMFLYIFGSIKSYKVERAGLLKYIILCLSPIVLSPIFLVLETCAIILALSSIRITEFHIVTKDMKDTHTGVIDV